MVNTFADESLRSGLEGFLQEARQTAGKLQAEWQYAEALRVFWETLNIYVQKGWVCHIQDHLERETDRLKIWRSEGHPAIASLESLYRDSKTAAEKAMLTFPHDLEQACAEARLPLDRTSREPHYTFENGFLALDVDSAKKLAHLKDREAKLATVVADVGAVVEAVAAEYRRLFERPFDGGTFLKKLRKQYLAVLKKQGLNDGEVLPIRRITHRLGKNEKGFRTDEFLVDLSRLVENGPLQVGDVILDLQQTKDTNQGMLLHGPAARGYVGFILFRKA